VGALLVVVAPEGVELGLELAQGPGPGLGSKPLLQGPVEAFDLPAGLRVVRGGVLLLDPESGQLGLEPVAGNPAAAPACEPGGEYQGVVG